MSFERSTENSSNKKVLLILEEDDYEPESFYLFDPDDSYRGDATSTADEVCHTGQVQSQQLLNSVYIDLFYKDSTYKLDETSECQFTLFENGRPVTNKTKIINTLNSLFKVCYVIEENSPHPSWYKPSNGTTLSDDDIEEMLEKAHRNYLRNRNN